MLNYKFIQQSVVASSKAVVEDVAEPNISNAAEKVAVLMSEERQCSADVQAIPRVVPRKFWLLHPE